MSWIIREINPATEPAILDSVIALRLRCWQRQMQVLLTRADLMDPFDDTARHWAAFVDDQVVGAARLSIHDRLEDVPEADCLLCAFACPPPRPIGFLSRLVVAPEHRRHGLGRKLDEIRIRAAEQSGCRSLLALVFDPSGAARVAQLTALGFSPRGRGSKDSHPTFSALPPPVVLERLLPAGAAEASSPPP